MIDLNNQLVKHFLSGGEVKTKSRPFSFTSLKICDNLTIGNILRNPEYYEIFNEPWIDKEFQFFETDYKEFEARNGAIILAKEFLKRLNICREKIENKFKEDLNNNNFSIKIEHLDSYKILIELIGEENLKDGQ